MRGVPHPHKVKSNVNVCLHVMQSAVRVCLWFPRKSHPNAVPWPSYLWFLWPLMIPFHLRCRFQRESEAKACLAESVRMEQLKCETEPIAADGLKTLPVKRNGSSGLLSLAS